MTSAGKLPHLPPRFQTNSFTGQLIWGAVKPQLQLLLIMVIGFIATRAGKFTDYAAKGMSSFLLCAPVEGVILHLKDVLAQINNIKAIGPLFVAGFLWEGIGLCFGLIIREVAYVPLDFKKGILVLTSHSNWGNMPLLVLQSVFSSKPFNSATDPHLGASYLSVFILVYTITFFMLPVSVSIKKDYSPGVPHGPAAEVRMPWHERPLTKAIIKITRVLRHPQQEDEGASSAHPTLPVPVLTHRRAFLTQSSDSNIELEALDLAADFVSRRSASTEIQPTDNAPEHSVTLDRASAKKQEGSILPTSAPDASTEVSEKRTKRQKIGKVLYNSVMQLVTAPVTIAVAVALPISLIKPLRALFVDTEGYSQSLFFKALRFTEEGLPDYHDPTGYPPLSWLLDIASSLGSPAAPLGVFLLGCGFARMKIPRPITRLPWVAMISVSLGKLVILPAIGILVVQGFVHTGWISEDDKVLRFTMMFLAGTPAALNQLIVTQLYCGDFDVDTLCAFLLVQYALMLFVTSALVAVCLKIIGA